MNAVIEAPRDFVESLADLKFPPKTDAWLQDLMDRNNEGRLSALERNELEALVELSETMSLYRAKALQLLGRKP
jgi:hypothetical protein